MRLAPYIIVSDESGTEQRVQSVCFVAGPADAMESLNAACAQALTDAGTSEIKFKDIESAAKRQAAEAALRAFLDCPNCRAMVLSWSLLDSRHKVQGRDDIANFHRMLFHGLRSVADWFGDVEWHWYHDENAALDQEELKQFLNNTRGYKAFSGMPVDLFGNERHIIRFKKVEQRCSKKLPLIGLADLLAGAVRYSIVDATGCIAEYNSSPAQGSLDLPEIPQPDPATKGETAKRKMVAHIRRECERRKLGVSLESTNRLATHKKRSKLWIWHYEPQGDYDKAPTKDQRFNV